MAAESSWHTYCTKLRHCHPLCKRTERHAYRCWRAVVQPVRRAAVVATRCSASRPTSGSKIVSTQLSPGHRNDDRGYGLSLVQLASLHPAGPHSAPVPRGTAVDDGWATHAGLHRCKNVGKTILLASKRVERKKYVRNVIKTSIGCLWQQHTAYSWSRPIDYSQ